MTLQKLFGLFLRNMGYSRNDAEEPDVQEEYRENALRWLNEGYVRAVERLKGADAAEDLTLMVEDSDEPEELPENLHPYLADYAAGRGQELRGNNSIAAGLYLSFEKALAEAGKKKNAAFGAWHRL